MVQIGLAYCDSRLVGDQAEASTTASLILLLLVAPMLLLLLMVLWWWWWWLLLDLSPGINIIIPSISIVVMRRIVQILITVNIMITTVITSIIAVVMKIIHKPRLLLLLASLLHGGSNWRSAVRPQEAWIQGLLLLVVVVELLIMLLLLLAAAAVVQVVAAVGAKLRRLLLWRHGHVLSVNVHGRLLLVLQLLVLRVGLVVLELLLPL